MTFSGARFLYGWCEPAGMATDDPEETPRGKVERVIATHGLDDMGETLARLWTREEDRYSLRELADYLNQALLRSTMESAGMRPLEGEVENTYRLLTDADVSSGSRRQAERVLEREGVDVEAVRRDFVSHQSVHTYLREHRGVEQESGESPEDRRSKAKDTIERLRSRTEAVTANLLDGIADDDGVPVEDLDVVVNIRVLDRSTGEAYDIDELIDEE